MRRVAVEFAHVVGDDVMGGVLVLAMVVNGPVRKGFGSTDEQPVVINRIGVIDGYDHVAIEAINTAAIPMNAIEDILAIAQFTQPACVRRHRCSLGTPFGNHDALPPFHDKGR